MEITIEMEVIECANCGMPFGVTKDRIQRLRKCHNLFYCPAGHLNNFPSKTEEEKLKDEISAKEREIEILKANQKKKSTRKARSQRYECVC